MKIKDIKEIDINWLYWYFKLGFPKKKISSLQLIHDINNYIRQPVFFLSTGRCGTKWFTELLKNDKKNAVFHNPVPTFARQNKYLYKHYVSNNYNPGEDIKELIREILFAGREEVFRYTYKTDKRYVETNNYITFFAPALSEIFTDARYVLLTRHPIDFINSAYQRGYYSNTADDDRRIFPVKKNERLVWEKMTRIEKIAWLWKSTYGFVNQFVSKKDIDIITFDFNKLSLESVMSLLEELSIDVPPKKVKKLLPQKINAQKIIVRDLKHEIALNMDSVKTICGEIAGNFGYNL